MMIVRSLIAVVAVLITVYRVVDGAALAQSDPTVAAVTGLEMSLHSTGAVSNTVYLPVIFNCYPRQGSDPDFYLQYDMSLINADMAWGLCSLNASSVTIAIIDTGVDLTHPDLQANIVSGYDFVNGDSVPEDGNGHGTNVAGIAAAALNGVHVAGVAPTARILPVRVLDDSGGGYISDVADGIVYAADRAQILNLSLGSSTNSATLANAINYAVNTKGRLVVAAAGNCGDGYFSYNGCSYMNQPLYPGAYSNVMAVAATTSADTRASFSNVGSYVDIAAPGYSIYNAFNGTSYGYESGTSQAAPHVAGLAALIWAKNSGYSAAQVWSRITSTAVDLGTAGVDSAFGAGRIDVQQALGLTALSATTPAARQLLAPSAVISDQRAAPIAAGRVIVKFNESASLKSVATTLQTMTDATVHNTLSALDALVLSVPVGGEWDTIDQLRAQPDVEYAEPDYQVQALR